MSAHQTPAPMTEGEAGFGAGQTPASPTVPLGEAGPHFSDADAMGAPASEGPRWAPVDSGTGDLLDLLANEHPATPQERDEWVFFINILHGFSRPTGFIDQNNVREELRGKVKANRVGAFYRRALLEGLIEPAGWVVSTDTVGKNSGRPCRMYRWLGTTA